jgi:hypothetical protein
LTIIRPRLNDFHDLPFTQSQVDFVIPFLDEDIPFYVDPFLLWKSPSMQDNALHTAVVNSFNHLGKLVNRGDEITAVEILIRSSECQEVGLGVSKTKRGARISNKVAQNILALFRNIPQVREQGFTHFEEIQLLVDNIAKDRVSDIACNFIKSFLIDFTMDQCEKYNIPMVATSTLSIYDYKFNKFAEENVFLPHNPETNMPIILVPKRWIRHYTWIGYDDYYEKFYIPEIGLDENNPPDRIAILNFNRHNYGLVESYVKRKELTQDDCKNDPLFNPIPVLSAKRKLSAILNLPTGKIDQADRKYEDNISQLLASLLYPDLDFAQEQSRTESGVLIRDLIFYNNRSWDFLQDIYEDFGSRQLVFELKNVAKIEREHINQLNRYLNQNLGKFGVIVTRNPLPKNIFENTIDLWSGQRTCIIALTDADIELMVATYEDRQRLPIEVLKRSYIEFIRKCPS